MGAEEWEELLGSAVRKRIVADGDGDSPDLGSLVLFSWKGNVLLTDGATGETFAERDRVTARIGDGDEVPGDLNSPFSVCNGVMSQTPCSFFCKTCLRILVDVKSAM